MKPKFSLSQIDRTAMPFRTPEGYFEGFTERLMAQIPDALETSTNRPLPAYLRLWHKARRPLTAIAAAVALVALFSQMWTVQSKSIDAFQATQTATSSSEAQVDELYDYLLLDSETLYAYASADY